MKLIKFMVTPSACCVDEWVNVTATRYDLERLNFFQTQRPEEAQLLIVQGYLSPKTRDWLLQALEVMPQDKKIMATGACACGGGIFSDQGIVGQPIDVFVPGCPPRPEAMIDGLLLLYPDRVTGQRVARGDGSVLSDGGIR
jgi:NADH-quinone oxidoreductase subunit B